jgi:SAM-dependent methyltransferase
MLTQDNWKDPGFAASWDKGHNEGNPARAAHLALLTEALHGIELPEGSVLDLGVGSGLVAELLIPLLGDRKYIGIDGSEAMLALARKRLARFGDQVALEQADLKSLRLDDSAVRTAVAICVQTLHNLPPDGQNYLIQSVANRLAARGWFFIIDRVLADPPTLYPAFRSVWTLQKRSDPESRPAPKTFDEYAAVLEGKGDRPRSAEAIVAQLRKVGLAAACIDCRGDRAFIAALRV